MVNYAVKKMKAAGRREQMRAGEVVRPRYWRMRSSGDSPHLPNCKGNVASFFVCECKFAKVFWLLWGRFKPLEFGGASEMTSEYFVYVLHRVAPTADVHTFERGSRFTKDGCARCMAAISSMAPRASHIRESGSATAPTSMQEPAVRALRTATTAAAFVLQIY